jgi:hypothetical protein
VKVLDSTDPAGVQVVERDLDFDETLFILSSKSGTTLEAESFYRYFSSKVEPEQFVAITDPGTPLERLAREKGFRRTFINPSDVGGRFSALSYFGLIPAALLGLDLAKFLENASQMVQACSSANSVSDNPGLWLGAVLGEGALAQKPNLTLVLSPEIALLGSWIEQIVAESLGKEEKGIVPIYGEPVGDPPLYDASRFFVYLRYAKTGSAYLDGKMKALADVGHTVVQIELKDLYDFASEFFLWEMATVVAGAILGVNPLDEPNVKESKEITAEFIKKFQEEGRLDEGSSIVEEDRISIYTDEGLKLKPGKATTVEEILATHLSRLEPGEFVAWLVYLPQTPEVDREIESMRHGIFHILRAPTSVGYGPRYLHSTGQLFKGGPNRGVFIQITSDDPTDVLIPSAHYSFGILKKAQALGDFHALCRHGRRVIHCHLHGNPLEGLKKLNAHFDAVI